MSHFRKNSIFAQTGLIRDLLNPIEYFVMTKTKFCWLAFTLLAARGFAQTDSVKQNMRQNPEIYKIHYKVEVPATVVAAGITLLNFSGISKKSNSTEAQIESLDKSNIPFFDRWTVHVYSKSLDQASYIPFYVAIPLPLLCLVDKKMRQDFWKIGYLYIEALAATGVVYSTAVNLTNRYRPFTYNLKSPMDLAMESNSKKSFFAGHVALVATSSFFMARVYADYHPDSKLKWVFYGGAGALTAATGIMRNLAGMHFLSDVLLGAAVGTCSGLLVPGLHKIKPGKPPHLTILPFGGTGAGFTAIYKL
jgi:membrane-associated phospholipid phosphatase